MWNCLFLNTDNSIGESSFNKADITLSPWIYHELLITKLIEKRKPERLSYGLEKHENSVFDSIQESIKIEYDPEIDHLYELDERGLREWNFKVLQGTPALDVLYLLSGDRH